MIEDYTLKVKPFEIKEVKRKLNRYSDLSDRELTIAREYNLI